MKNLTKEELKEFIFNKIKKNFELIEYHSSQGNFTFSYEGMNEAYKDIAVEFGLVENWEEFPKYYYVDLNNGKILKRD